MKLGPILLTFLALAQVPSMAQDAYYHVPLSSLPLTEGKMPTHFEWSRWAWTMGEALEPYAVLDGDGDAFVGVPVKVLIPISRRFSGGQALLERAFAVRDQELALGEIDDVSAESAWAPFRIGPERLVGGQGKEVVADDVLVAAVVEHQAAAERVIDEVVFDQLVPAMRIQVDAPPQGRRRVGPQVVEHVVPDDAAGRNAQAIDQARIAQDALAEIVDVVELDDVIRGPVRLQAPIPADADPGVVEVVKELCAS